MTDSYNVVVRKSAEKELRGIPKPDLVRVVARIRSLATAPRPHGCERMAASDHHRIRQGDWRVVYAIEDRTRTVTIVRVGHRREVYR